MANLYIYIFLTMLFMHVLDDYVLQGVLAKLKTETYWKDDNNYPEEIRDKKHRYKDDWMPALFMHSFSWSFMITLPLIIFLNALESEFNISILIGLVLVNTVIHIFTDDLKANRYMINLWVDQSIHVIQIILSLVTWVLVVG